MTNIVKLMMGTSIANGKELLKRNFKGLSWWSDNLETVAHYYEGAVIEITVELDHSKQIEYVREVEDINRLNIPLTEYTYGFAEMRCPEGAVWYSFGGVYLEEYVIDVKEIFPDLSEFNEDGSGY